MCTQTEVIEEPEVVEEPRDIDTLLSLNTYQGMTDEEIDLVLDYKINQAVFSAEMTAKNAAIIMHTEAMIADSRAMCERTKDVLQYLIDNGAPEVKSPEMKIFEPRILEV